jgi:hypothetical protein
MKATQEAKSIPCSRMLRAHALPKVANKHLAEIHHKITFFVAKMIYELFYIINTNDCRACRYFEIKTQRDIETKKYWDFV